MIGHVVGIIMAGGAGTRLWPLTKDRAKPAVPLAGKFRLIDISISNCINSRVNKIFVLTQFNSASLNQHIARTYFFAPFSGSFVQILAAQQTTDTMDWYQGTADSVRKNLRYFLDRRDADYMLILAGDHLYSMDYRKLLDFHIHKGADVTVGVLPVMKNQTKDFGILKLNNRSQITDFTEKPKDEAVLERFKISDKWMERESFEPNGKEYLGSMGIYLFNRRVLEDILAECDHADFGKGIIPYAIKNRKVFGYLFRGYWEDVGTIGSFYRTMMDLVEPVPKFNFYEAERPIYTRPRYLPGAKITDCQMYRSIINEGAILEKCQIEDSMIGIRTHVRSGTRISRSVIMGRDYFETSDNHEENIRLGRPNAGIGRDCVIEKAIVDKNARIGDGVQILDRNRGTDVDTDNWVIREGIVIIPKNATIQPGTVIG
jgi:glucose-1-phosphate adenylyltransferase